ncbi:MAG: hypothetical protein R6X32_21505 [Chloroflexota bacterium]|jgi:hypothetical protein
MQVNCPLCPATFDLSVDYLTYAVAESDKRDHKFHMVECPRCRKTVKVDVSKMRGAIPEGEEEE